MMYLSCILAKRMQIKVMSKKLWFDNKLFSTIILQNNQNSNQLYSKLSKYYICEFCFVNTSCRPFLQPTVFNFYQRLSYKFFSRNTKPLLKQNSSIFRRLLHRFKHTEASSAKGKPKLFFKTPEFRRLISLAKPEKWKLTGAILLLLISSTVTMAVPFGLGKVIDLIYNSDAEKMRENLNHFCIFLTVLFLLGGLCNFGRVYLMSISGYRITQALRKKVFSSIVKQEVAFFDQNKTGELINRLSADTSLVSQSVTMNISDGLRSSVMVVAGITMMFYMSPQLAIVGLAVVPPIAGIAIVYGRFVRKITKAVQDSLAQATEVADERIANIRTVKTFSQEWREYDNYAQKIHDVLLLSYKESFAKGVFFGMTGLSGNIIILSVLYYGGVMVSDSTLTVGKLSSFLLYAAYIGVSIGGLSSFYSEMNRGIGASTRLWEIVDRTPTIPIRGGYVPSAEPCGRILFDNVTFSYPCRKDVPILHDLTLEIPAGSVTAVVGPSGSGKSTLAALLLRLYDPDKGRILLDAHGIDMLDPYWLRKHIGTVSQEPVLFSSSIRENIIYGADDPTSITEEELCAVAKEANVYDFVMKTLPEAFETRVGERGIMLSGGQKQRVAIARALMKNPRILLLDEATSALDAESEHLVQEALERVMKSRTVLVIAHRLSTIKSADQIVVLDQGSIREKGSYESLMSIPDGAFRRLVQHQTVGGQTNAEDGERALSNRL